MSTPSLSTSLPKPPCPFPLRLSAIRAPHNNPISTSIRLLIPPLPPSLDVAPTRTATAQAGLHQPGEYSKCARHPHESKHGDANVGANVDLSDAANNIPEDDEHGGRDDGGGRYEECVEEGEDGDAQGPPSGDNADGHEEHENEGQAGGREEKAEHDLGCYLDQVEDIVDVGGEVDWGTLVWSHSTFRKVGRRTRSTSKQLIPQNLHRIKPIKRLRLRAKSNPLTHIPLTKSPKSHLVEVMQPQRLRNRIDEGKVGDRSWNDVANVYLDKVPVADEVAVVDAPDFDEDEEDDGDEEEEGGKDCPYLASPSGALDLVFGGFGDDGGSGVG